MAELRYWDCREACWVVWRPPDVAQAPDETDQPVTGSVRDSAR